MAKENMFQQQEELGLDADSVRSLILSYLIHNCYVETAHAFMQACGLEEQWKAQSIGIHDRKRKLFPLFLACADRNV